MTFPFMKHRYTILGVSFVLVLFAIVTLMFKGLNYGIYFKGGSIIQLRFDQDMDETSIRNVFKTIEQNRDLYFSSDQIVVQAVSNVPNREFIIHYPAPLVDSQKTAEIHDVIIDDLKREAPFSEETLQTASVGPTIGAEMYKNGVWAAVLSIIGILLYIIYRFELQSALGAIVAITFNLFMTLGFLSLLGLEFDVTVLAAILTLLGYSVNDSIVILDRVRENKRITKHNDLEKLVNDSINQTLSRTLNTSITTLLALISLLLLGEVTIYGFAVTLTFGVVVGTLSSMLICPSIFHELSAKKIKK